MVRRVGRLRGFRLRQESVAEFSAESPGNIESKDLVMNYCSFFVIPTKAGIQESRKSSWCTPWIRAFAGMRS
jgi:hypothetical protein